MNKIKPLFIFVFVLALLGCEKVIDIDINDADRKLVVEAFTSNIEGRNFIKISRTGNVYTTNNFEKVSNASVEITDKNGTIYTFNENPNELGTYILPNYKVEENQTYTLKVVADGEEITAISQSSFVPTIDSIRSYPGYVISGNPNDTARLAFYWFKDPIPSGDNYRLIVSVNDTVDPYYYIGNDVLGSGLQVSGLFFASSFEPGDEVHVELLTMDEAGYDYYYSLVNNTSTGPFAASPANPVSNLSENALGYFGAYLMDTTTITVF